MLELSNETNLLDVMVPSAVYKVSIVPPPEPRKANETFVLLGVPLAGIGELDSPKDLPPTHLRSKIKSLPLPATAGFPTLAEPLFI